MANTSSITGGTSPTTAVYGKDAAETSAPIKPSSAGNDTINLGSGSDTIVQIGQATVTSAFTTLMNAGSVAGGAYTHAAGVLGGVQLDVAGVLGGAQLDVAGVLGGAQIDVAGVLGGAKLDVATVIGGALDEVGTTAHSLSGVFSGVKADLNALPGGFGTDSPAGAAANHLFEMAASGPQTVANFVSPDQMTVDGYSLSYLQANHDISSQGGNTYISIDGGKTSIELKGIGGLTNSENTHKT